MTQANSHTQAIAQAFSNAANTYDRAAIIEQEIGARLLARLSDLNLSPRYILDLGCGTGLFTQQLQQLYPQAYVIGLDLALGMLNFAIQQRPAAYCCADATLLPFAHNQFDLIFANCCLPYVKNLPLLFAELQRALNTNGALLFSTFGPDTLQELGLEHAWPDMHHIGDLLLQHNYKNPVVDTEHLYFEYDRMLTLCTDLQESGTFHIDPQQISNALTPITVTFEITYGAAYKDINKQFKDATGTAYIPISQIKHLHT